MLTSGCHSPQKVSFPCGALQIQSKPSRFNVHLESDCTRCKSNESAYTPCPVPQCDSMEAQKPGKLSIEHRGDLCALAQQQLFGCSVVWAAEVQKSSWCNENQEKPRFSYERWDVIVFVWEIYIVWHNCQV